MKRFLKKNVFNILFASLLILVFGLLSTWELESEIEAGTGHLKNPVEVSYAEEASGKYVPSVQQMIIDSCHDYGIDSEIPLAIAELETGHFTSAAFREGNNVGGMSIGEEPIYYKSIEDGVDAFVRNLSENYYDKGLITVDQISRKYCPMNAEGWSDAVKEIKNEKE